MNKKQWLTLPAKVALSFLGGILLGTFLLCLPISSSSGQWWSFIDALFTSTSAVCVTGLVVVDTAVHFSLFGQIVLLVLIQIGGLGFISMSVLLLLWAGKKTQFQKQNGTSRKFEQRKQSRCCYSSQKNCNTCVFN